MEATWESKDGSIRLYLGDVHTCLHELPEQSVHCCVTSPPYWALRSYLPTDDPLKALEMGSEKTPDEHVAAMVVVFAEVRRVLRDDGLLWVNYGQTYGSRPGGSHGGFDGRGGSRKLRGQEGNHAEQDTGLEPLQCIGIPERFALAMQADGWLWRDTIIWHKKSPMPASLSGTRWERCKVKVAGQQLGTSRYAELRADRRSNLRWGETDKPSAVTNAQWLDCSGCPKCEANGGYVLRRGSWRTTPAHEYIFMFAKQAGYFADQEGVKEKALNTCTGRTVGKKANGRAQGECLANADYGEKIIAVNLATRNPRSVMSFRAHNLKEAHYAAFPPGLPEFCIKASTSPEGCCPICGAAWARVVDNRYIKLQETNNTTRTDGIVNRYDHAKWPRMAFDTKTLGFRSTCKCGGWACATCGYVTVSQYGNNTTNEKVEIMPSMQEKLPVDSNEKAHLLQSKMLLPVREETPGPSMRIMREGISATEPQGQVLQQILLKSLDSATPNFMEGMDENIEGLRGDIPTDASCGLKRRICDGTSPCRGEAAGEISGEERSGSPPESHQRRQSRRKSNSRNPPKPQSVAQGESHCDMPALPQKVSADRTCPRCSGKLILRPLAPAPSVILDCFSGAGTTGLVAARLGMNYIGIELNPKYNEIARRRIERELKQCPLFAAQEAGE